jgi:3-oxoacyl-[acyl-carrier-protein] synthase-1/3-oxoacyl-[acyl-carrier-protein] synthase II
MSAAIVAYGAISGLGRGEAAASAGSVGEPARIVTKDDAELAASKLARPFCSRAELESSDPDRATTILRVAMDDLFRALDARMPDWRGKRVGLALASSSGGMRSAMELFASLRAEKPVPRELGERATYFAPMLEVVKDRFSPSTLVLTACSASTIAIGIGIGWLEGGACDLVIAGGFDAVSVFVASGFEALRATTAKLPSRPFGIDRDGMSLGEGAALLALLPSTAPEAKGAIGFVTGFGASGDAVHVTAPDRTGAGLARAATRALGAHRDADVDGSAKRAVADVDLVSAHGTATPFNDAAEWKAIVSALGEVTASHAVVHPFKAQIGHTLGAAGALESLAALDAMTRGVLPASVIAPARDPETPARLLDRTETGAPNSALKLSAAFGGANAALVLRKTAEPSSRPKRRDRAYASVASYVSAVPPLDELAKITGIAAEKLARADDLVFLAMAAIGGLVKRDLNVRDAGIVIGHAYATVDVNDRYFQRVLEKNDARAAEGRRFPYTSPNAVAGECSLAFHLTGPNLAVGSGLHGGVEALAIAADLVRAGDADRVVAVAVDAPRRAARAIAESCGWPCPRDGAVAVLVSREPIGPEIVSTESATLGAPELPRAPGHEALIPLTRGATSVACASPWGAFARVELAR